MPGKVVNVMVRFSPEEHLALRAAWSSSAHDWQTRLPFAAWVKRTLIQLFPPKAAKSNKPSKPKKPARKAA